MYTTQIGSVRSSIQSPEFMQFAALDLILFSIGLYQNTIWEPSVTPVKRERTRWNREKVAYNGFGTSTLGRALNSEE